MKEFFIDQADEHLSQMRLLVEGGLVMYEGLRKEKNALFLDLVGEALYSIQSHITECQEQLIQEVRRQNEETFLQNGR